MSFEIHMLPLQAGDATLLIDRSDGNSVAVLIDAGLDKFTLRDYLRQISLNHIDLAILSHPDLDHIQGLLAVLNEPNIVIREIWCFDLTFLRQYVMNGTLSRPPSPTHQIIYERLLFSLITHDRILTQANDKVIPCFQVSEGFMLQLGRMKLEVLHPSVYFYCNLYSPQMLRKLLGEKKTPRHWASTSSRRLLIQDQQHMRLVRKRLDNELSLQRHECLETGTELLSQRGVLLANGINDEALLDTGEEEKVLTATNSVTTNIPISLIGTLYNNLSLVVRVSVELPRFPLTMLFPGDLTDWTELTAKYGCELGADIFKYPHHGSTKSGICAERLGGIPRCFLCLWTPTEVFTDRWRRAPVFFSGLVRPRRTIIFPYPQHSLPKAGALCAKLGGIYTNRKNKNRDALGDSNNIPCETIIRFKG